MMRRLKNESKRWQEFNSRGDRQISLDLETKIVHVFYMNISKKVMKMRQTMRCSMKT